MTEIETIVRICYRDGSRPCPGYIDPDGEFQMCQAWDEAQEECIFLLAAKGFFRNQPRMTVFPESAKPPEVR